MSSQGRSPLVAPQELQDTEIEKIEDLPPAVPAEGEDNVAQESVEEAPEAQHGEGAESSVAAVVPEASAEVVTETPVVVVPDTVVPPDEPTSEVSAAFFDHTYRG